MTNLQSVATRIGPLHFQAGGRRGRPNLALVFLDSFYALVYFVTDACLLFYVSFSFSILSQGLRRMSPK